MLSLIVMVLKFFHVIACIFHVAAFLPNDASLFCLSIHLVIHIVLLPLLAAMNKAAKNFYVLHVLNLFFFEMRSHYTVQADVEITL